MSEQNFNISADGQFAIDGGTIKFTGTIILVRQDVGKSTENTTVEPLKVVDEAEVSEEESSDGESKKSTNLLEESAEDADTDTDTDDADKVPPLSTPPYSSYSSRIGGQGTRSKIQFHDDSDVCDDWQLSQTVEGFGLD